MKDAELLVCTDMKHWDELLSRSPQRNVFCRSDFLSALGTKHELLLVCQNGTPLLGAVIALGADGNPRPGPQPYTMYQGHWFTEAFEKLSPHSRVSEGLRLLDFLLEKLESRYNRFCLTSHWDFGDLRSFSWFHYNEPERGRCRMELLYTGLIALDRHESFDSYLAGVRKSRRYDYGRREELGLKIEDSKDVETFLHLYRATFERQNIQLQEDKVELAGKIARSALENRYGELTLCRSREGEPISAALFLFDERSCYYLFGANDPAHRALPGGTVVFLENVRRAFERGLGLVDVCGMNSPNRGDFKSSFNAAPSPYLQVSWGS